MACAGFNCSSHNIGNSQCSGHRPPCPSNGTIIPNVTVGSVITQAACDALRTQVVAQINAWNSWLTSSQNAPNPSGYTVYNPTINQLAVIRAQHILDLNNDLEQVRNYSAVGGKNPGVPGMPTTSRTVTTGSYVSQPGQGGIVVNDRIEAAEWNAIINSYNVIRQNCICNSDCHCNAVCACFNNCGCNYSDERLKENIKFIEQKFGLNIYEFTYIWDNTKKFIGALAQEVLNSSWAGAVSQDSNGYYQIDYSRLPIDMKEAI